MKSFIIFTLITMVAAVALLTDINKTYHNPILFRSRLNSRFSPLLEPTKLANTKSIYPLTSNSEITTEIWAGAAYSAPPNNTYFTTISATFTVPQPSIPSPLPESSTPSTEYRTAIWIGIDGLTYRGVIFQAGVIITVSTNTTTKQPIHKYYAIVEWLPQPLIVLPSFLITAGDVLAVNLTATNSSSGVVKFFNSNSNQTLLHSISAPSPAAFLAGRNAEWIVEAPTTGVNSTPFPWADFSRVKFSRCEAGTADGKIFGSLGADKIDIKDPISGQIRTSVSLPRNGVVEVSKLKSKS